VGTISRRESAKRDLIALWVWYAESGSVEVADRFLAAVEATLQMLSTQPEMGAAGVFQSEELRGMRRFPVGDGFESILLFYFPKAGGVDLVRVVHGSRDLGRLFVEGFPG
jgi:toxin ParE1/3/4